MVSVSLEEKMLGDYLIAAMWTDAVDSSDDDDTNFLAAGYSVEDFGDGEVDRARSDIQRFIRIADERDLTSMILDHWPYPGHDLWLTRNHHGTGFWDRFYDKSDPLSLLGDELTEIADELGETGIYLGDDGKIYFE